MTPPWTVDVKTGRIDGIVSSYNLFFSNGLRLKTDALHFATKDQREVTLRQFEDVVALLEATGVEVRRG